MGAPENTFTTETRIQKCNSHTFTASPAPLMQKKILEITEMGMTEHRSVASQAHFSYFTQNHT